MPQERRICRSPRRILTEGDKSFPKSQCPLPPTPAHPKSICFVNSDLCRLHLPEKWQPVDNKIAHLSWPQMGFDAQKRRHVGEKATRCHTGTTFQTRPSETVCRRKKNKGVGRRGDSEEVIRAPRPLLVPRLLARGTDVSPLTNQFGQNCLSFITVMSHCPYQT